MVSEKVLPVVILTCLRNLATGLLSRERGLLAVFLENHSLGRWADILSDPWSFLPGL